MSNNFQSVMAHFEALTRIPRGSTNCAGVRDYLCRFAAQNGLRYRRDEADNVVIWKAASPGFESRQCVILQGHTDMVCAAEKEGCIDFLKDALKLKHEGDFLFAEGTSLGADDGIAVAMMLALLESDVPCGALCCIFTADEEIGMLGAAALDMRDIDGKYFINLDSEDEGVLTVSCAGGSTAVIHIPFERQLRQAHVYEVRIAGLAGGHSGVEIIKGGLNANKLLAELLQEVPAARILDIGGGEKENAIATRAKLRVALEQPWDYSELVQALTARWREKEPILQLQVEYMGFLPVQPMGAESSKRIGKALAQMPQGIIQMSAFEPNAVQTSLNLGVITCAQDEVRFTFSVRSSIAKEREALEAVLNNIALEAQGTLELSGIYPGWAYQPESVLREKAVAVFREQFGYTPKIESIHAGLECGVLLAKKPKLECISFGPQLYDVHTARERLSLSSAEKTWRYLLALLGAL